MSGSKRRGLQIFLPLSIKTYTQCCLYSPIDFAGRGRGRNSSGRRKGGDSTDELSAEVLDEIMRRLEGEEGS